VIEQLKALDFRVCVWIPLISVRNRCSTNWRRRVLLKDARTGERIATVDLEPSARADAVAQSACSTSRSPSLRYWRDRHRSSSNSAWT